MSRSALRIAPRTKPRKTRCHVGDFFAFRRMIAPVLIHIFYWLASLGLLAIGVLMIIDKMDLFWDQIQELTKDGGHGLGFLKGLWTNPGDKTTKVALGIAVAIGGPLFIPLYCEFIMLPVPINEPLT